MLFHSLALPPIDAVPVQNASPILKHAEYIKFMRDCQFAFIVLEQVYLIAPFHCYSVTFLVWIGHHAGLGQPRTLLIGFI
jgi:hypothetical protein